MGETEGGSYSISRLESVVVAIVVSNVTLENLEIRYSRGAGVSVIDSTDFVIKGCTISNHGMLGDGSQHYGGEGPWCSGFRGWRQR